ncbi:hypothetical protein D4R99_04980, partial [bacterium]
MMRIKKIASLALIVLILFLLRLQLSYYDLNRQPKPIEKIELINPSSILLDENKNVSPQSIIDGNVQLGWNCLVKQKDNCDTVVRFATPSKISLIEIFFSLNLVKEIEVEYQSSPESLWKPLGTVENNNFSQVTFTTHDLEAINISSLKFTFKNPSSESNPIGIGEIRAFYQPPTNGLVRLLKHIFIVKREPLSYLFYSTIFITATLLLGYGLTFKPYKRTTPLNLSLTWMKGIVAISLLGVILLITGSDILTAILFITLLAISTIQYLITPTTINKETSPLIILLLIYLIN